MSVVFRNRETGELIAEKVFAERELRFLYGTRAGRLVDHLLVKRQPVSHVWGLLQRRRRGARRRIANFVARLGIDPSEAEKPLEAYDTLDDFFTRRLRPGARPIDAAPEHLICPADGRILVIPEVRGRVVVKGSAWTLAEVLEDEALARRYEGGACLVVRLAPADYHRFHFPDGGAASAPWPLGRHLHSVHPLALASGAVSFRNKRSLTRLESDGFGELLLVEVGATFVGTIVQTYRAGRVERGQEKGYFRFGGSTTMLLALPGVLEFDDDLVWDSERGLENLVKLGAKIGAARRGA